MKKASKFDKWVDRSIISLMELTDDKNLLKIGESPPGVREGSIFLQIPSQAEASDFLSINDWIEPKEDLPPY
jgi:hypothetical protein